MGQNKWCVIIRAVPYIIGVTGNLGSGKSLVLGMLGELGAYTIDADALVREVSRPGSAAWQEIKVAFGPEILTEEEEINRPQLAKKVFSDPEALRHLEEILHPAVEKKTWELVEQAQEPVVAIEAVKLVEAGMHKKCNALWVVVCDPEVARKRLLASGRWSAEEIEARWKAQGSVEEKKVLADVVIDNTGTEAETRGQVKEAWANIPRAQKQGGRD
ncbi:MAG: dephospho-CoA kinase [Chloroflexi bacterium]|nr:dephospho-CoA kinase [Chloroflexota bacterium]